MAKLFEEAEGIKVPEHFKEALDFFAKGGVYQRLKHDCGYEGNAYHQVDGKWQKHTHCPQCNVELKWMPFEEVAKRLFFPEIDWEHPENNKPLDPQPRFIFNGVPIGGDDEVPKV